MAVNLAGEVFYEKAAVDAREFIAGRMQLPEGVRAVGVHTRMATKGAKGWNRNNHPVLAGEALVIHNGVVDDDHLERDPGHPEVDTYALAVAAYHARERLEGETDRQHAARIAEEMAKVDGSAACVVGFIGQPTMVSMKLNGSPMYYATAHGVRIAASTRKAVEECADAMGLQLPGKTETVTTKDAKGVETSKTRTVENIQMAETGRVLSWHAGSHFMQKIDVPDRVMTKSWRTGNGYGTGYASGRYTSDGRWVNGEFVPWDDDEYVGGSYVRGGASTTSGTGSASGLRPVSQIVPADGYPTGTPQPGSVEGDALARKFRFWRRSQHGVKWARDNSTLAAAYDAVANRRDASNQSVPPFPTKSELAAMDADPLFTSGATTQPSAQSLLTPPPRDESDDDSGSSIDDFSVAEIEALTDAEWEEWLSTGSITTRREVRSSGATYEAIATRMLADPGIALDESACTSCAFDADHHHQHALDVPGELDHGVELQSADAVLCDQCDQPFLDGEPMMGTNDGVLCDDCYRTYAYEGAWD